MSLAEQHLALEFYAVLQDIRRQELVTLANKPLLYKISDVVAFTRHTGVIIDIELWHQVFAKLAEMGAFTVVALPPSEIFPDFIIEKDPSFRMGADTFEVSIKQPRFDELYSNYEQEVLVVWGNKSKTKRQSDKITVQLLVQDNKLYLKTDGKLHQIRNFQASSEIESFMNFAVNSRPNTTIELNDYLTINVFAKNVTSFTELIRVSKLKPLKNIFIVELQPRKIKVVTVAEVSREELSQLLNAFS